MVSKSQSVIELKNCLVRPLSDSIKTTLFKNPLNLTIKPSERWAITGPRKNELLSIIAGKHIAVPPLSRSYPFLEKKSWPSQVTQFLEFKGSIQVSHLSARYEFFRDEFDYSLNEFLKQAAGTGEDHAYDIAQVVHKLKLDGLGERWVVGLSNGQMRRARLAKALLKNPQLLVLDEPYLGLDPSSRETISDVLELLPPNPHVVLGLRVQDRFPSWITHVAITGKDGIIEQGPLYEVEPKLTKIRQLQKEKTLSMLKSHTERKKIAGSASNDIVLKIDKISIGYRGQPVLKDLSWQIRKGEKWHLRGDNGSGKSTLLSLITADHPQSWNSKIIINGVPRKTGTQSYFSINEIIGHAAPEIHALFPMKLTVFDAISTGFVVGSMIPPRENITAEQRDRVNSLIETFNLNPKSQLSELSISDQKTVLFLRAVAKHPDILILDEAFSAMDQWRVEQCKEFMSSWEGTVITVGHIEDELILCDKYIRLLPESKTSEEGHIEPTL